MTLAEVGVEMGVTAERVRMILRRALRILGHPSRRLGPYRSREGVIENGRP